MSIFSSEGYDKFLKSKGTSRGKERKNAVNKTHPKVKESQKKYKELWNQIVAERNAVDNDIKLRDKVKTKLSNDKAAYKQLINDINYGRFNK
jgi:hypothetical protein